MRVFFLSLLFLFRELASFVLSVGLAAALALFYHAQTSETDLYDPQYQTNFVAYYIKFANLYQQIQIGEITAEHTRGQTQRIVLKDVQVQVSDKMRVFIPSVLLGFEGWLGILPSSITLQNPLFAIRMPDLKAALRATRRQQPPKSWVQKHLVPLPSFRSLFTLFSFDRRVVLTQARFRIDGARGTTHAYFENITATGQRVLKWQGRGELYIGASALPLDIRGKVDLARAEHYHSLSVKGVTPQRLADFLSPHASPSLGSARARTLRIDYNLSARGLERIKLLLARSPTRTILEIATVRSRPTFARRFDFHRAKIKLSGLSLEYLEALIPLLPYSPPLTIRARASGRLYVNKVLDKTAVKGRLTLSKGQARWRNNSAPPMLLSRAAVTLSGEARDLSVQGQVAFDTGEEPFIVVAKLGVKNQGNEWQGRVEVKNKNSLPSAALASFWLPTFKPRTRADVLNIVRGGELEQAQLVLKLAVALSPRPSFALQNLIGSFIWKNGKLRIGNDQTAFEDIEAKAYYTKKRIDLVLRNARHRDILLDQGKVSFIRRNLAGLGFNTYMILDVGGQGSAESARQFIQGAPFLQDSTGLQRATRRIPKTLISQVQGNLRLEAYIKQLRGDTRIKLPQEMTYQSHFRIEDIRFQPLLLRDYTARAEVTVKSHAEQTLLVKAEAETPEGHTLEGEWRDTLVQGTYATNAYLEGRFPTAALSRVYPFLPVPTSDISLRLDYEIEGESSPRGRLTVGLDETHLTLEAEGILEEFSFDGEVMDKEQTTLATLEGEFAPDIREGFLSLQGWGGNIAQIVLRRRGELPARLLLSGEKLNLAPWLKRKPWSSLKLSNRNPSPPATKPHKSSAASLTLPDFDADIRFETLQFHETRPQNGLDNIFGTIRTRGGRIQKIAFNTHRSNTKQNKDPQQKDPPYTTLLYAVEGAHELFSLQTDNLGNLVRQTHGSKSFKGGTLDMVLKRPYLPEQRPSPPFKGYARSKNLTLREAPIALRLFDAVGIVTNFVKGVGGLDMKTNLEFWDNVFTLQDFKIANNLTAVTAEGSVDVKEKRIDLKGEIASLPLLSDMLRYIPFVGYLLVGGKQNNLFAFSYEIQGDWEKPEMNVSPFTFFMPGVLKVVNPLQLIERDDIAKEKRQKRQKIVQEEKERKEKERKEKERKEKERKEKERRRTESSSTNQTPPLNR